MGSVKSENLNVTVLQIILTTISSTGTGPNET